MAHSDLAFVLRQGPLLAAKRTSGDDTGISPPEADIGLFQNTPIGIADPSRIHSIIPMHNGGSVPWRAPKNFSAPSISRGTSGPSFPPLIGGSLSNVT